MFRSLIEVDPMITIVDDFFNQLVKRKGMLIDDNTIRKLYS